MIILNSLTKNIKDGFKAPTGDSNRETPTKGALRFNTETGKPEVYAKGRGWRRASVSEIPAYVTDGLVLNLDAGNLNSYDGSGATWSDLSQEGNDGTINGATYDSNGYFSFGGSDYVSISHDSTLHQNTLTWEIWAYRSDWSSSGNGGTLQTLISKAQQSGYGLYYDKNTSRIRFEIHSGGSWRTLTYNFGSLSSGWHHFMGSYDGSTVKIYADGSLEGTLSHTGTIYYNYSQPVFIGAEAGTGNTPDSSYKFTGSVALTRLYNKALSSDEITQNFNASKARFGL